MGLAAAQLDDIRLLLRLVCPFSILSNLVVIYYCVLAQKGKRTQLGYMQSYLALSDIVISTSWIIGNQLDTHEVLLMTLGSLGHFFLVASSCWSFLIAVYCYTTVLHNKIADSYWQYYNAYGWGLPLFLTLAIFVGQAVLNRGNAFGDAMFEIWISQSYPEMRFVFYYPVLWAHFIATIAIYGRIGCMIRTTNKELMQSVRVTVSLQPQISQRNSVCENSVYDYATVSRMKRSVSGPLGPSTATTTSRPAALSSDTIAVQQIESSLDISFLHQSNIRRSRSICTSTNAMKQSLTGTLSSDIDTSTPDSITSNQFPSNNPTNLRKPSLRRAVTVSTRPNRPPGNQQQPHPAPLNNEIRRSVSTSLPYTIQENIVPNKQQRDLTLSPVLHVSADCLDNHHQKTASLQRQVSLSRPHPSPASYQQQQQTHSSFPTLKRSEKSIDRISHYSASHQQQQQHLHVRKSTAATTSTKTAAPPHEQLENTRRKLIVKTAFIAIGFLVSWTPATVLRISTFSFSSDFRSGGGGGGGGAAEIPESLYFLVGAGFAVSGFWNSGAYLIGVLWDRWQQQQTS